MIDPRKSAAASRRAAAMFLHWRRTDDTTADGVATVLGEIEILDDDSQLLICALLDVGTQMARATAARGLGEAEHYLREVVAEASMDEATRP